MFWPRKYFIIIPAGAGSAPTQHQGCGAPGGNAEATLELDDPCQASSSITTVPHPPSHRHHPEELSGHA